MRDTDQEIPAPKSPALVTRIIKKRATAAGFDGELFGGYSQECCSADGLVPS